MSKHNNPVVVANPWRTLDQFTDARIGLGRAGVSLPTSKLLEFQLAHARARDAVHFPFDVERLITDLRQYPTIARLGAAIHLQSQAPDRLTYLQRPDLGRQLTTAAEAQLDDMKTGAATPDLSVVIADGLSSAAVQCHAAPFLNVFLEALPIRWSLAPLTLVEQGRVAIGDAIGQGLNARMVVVLIGERPGLSSPDSLGIYLTFDPRPGKHDAERNCLSNIRPRGLDFKEAAQRLIYLLEEADRLSLSGVGLKDRSGDANPIGHSGSNFLVR